ncbi:MAG TPA: hypothetical protein VKB55_11980 [Nocardioidaceae bacterium]|nr:hypothetical protein [Nocardioidaceae bacterium]
MDDVRVEFRAGRDHYGQAVWAAALVVEREQRADGPWLKVLPAYSESDEAAHWVRETDIRSLVGSATDDGLGA